MPGQGGAETDLISLLTNQAQESEYLREAYDLIDKVQKAPSCNQLAAYQLLSSCKSLEVGPDGTETPVLLERVKNLYAARLAVCELQSASAPTPPQCDLIMSISLADLTDEEQPCLNHLWHGRDCMDAQVLQPCLKALHAQSTSWTSYSNNRGQAVTMCHAIRDHLERSQTADTHRKLIKVVSKMTDKTSEVSRVLAETQQRHTTNHLEVQGLFEDFMAKVHGEMESFYQNGAKAVDLLSDVTLSVASLQINLQDLSMKVKTASSDIDEVRQGVTGILKPVLEASSEISSHLVDVQDFIELAKPFISRGTEMANVVSDGWRKVQAAHSLLLNTLPKLGLIFSLTALGKCCGVQKRRILLATSGIVYGTYVINPVWSMIFATTSTFFTFMSRVPEWIRANYDVLAVSGLVIIAITFATVSIFWLDSIEQARRDLKVREEQKYEQIIRRHDRRKNLAVDLPIRKHHQDQERDRFRRAETAPPEFSKSEWV